MFYLAGQRAELVRLLESSPAGTAEAAGAFDGACLGAVVQENHSRIVGYVRLRNKKIAFFHTNPNQETGIRRHPDEKLT